MLFRSCRDFGPNAAVLFADLMNVEEMLENGGNLPKDDYFFQSIEDVIEYTGISRHFQVKGYGELRKKGFIDMVNKCKPRRRFFRIDYQCLFNYFADVKEDDFGQPISD